MTSLLTPHPVTTPTTSLRFESGKVGVLGKNMLLSLYTLNIGYGAERHFQQYSITISWRSVLLVEETGRPGENYQPDSSH